MLKNTLISAAVVALLAGAAHAQLNTPTPPQVADKMAAPAKMAAPEPVAAQPAPVAAKAEAVNPFIGKSVGLEARQRDLEAAKMDTALLEERIKQAALAEDLKTLPLKKSVEAAQATTARLKEEALQRDGGNKQGTGAANAPAVASSVTAQAASTPAAKPKTRPAKKHEVAKTEAPKEQPAAAVPVVPKVEVTSVLSLGGVRSAVLELDGNILTVRHGDTSPLGVVEVLDSQSVRVGGRVYKVHGATLARVSISDPKPVDPKAAQAPAPLQPMVTTTGAPPAASFSGNSTPANRSGTPVLPPLQLPAGVTLIPPSTR